MSRLTNQFFQRGYAPKRRRTDAANIYAASSRSYVWPFGLRKTKRPLTRAETRRKAASIGREEARRAVYIDFEGLIADPPTIVGILIGRKFEQVVLDSSLASAAEHSNCRSATMKKEMGRIIKLCRKERRALVAYSEHERTQIELHCNRDVTALYRNARKIAARWNDQRAIGRRISGTGLKDYLDAIGYSRPISVRQCSPARGIRLVQRAVARSGEYGATPRKAKAAWRRLLKYNEHDCRGMRQLVLRSATKPTTNQSPR